MKEHDIVAPSAWVVRWAPLITPGRVLDLACGGGRHARFLAGLGHEVTAVDREPRALAPGGVLIYETFMAGNERFGRPSNPAFLLAPGELWAAFAGLHIIAFEQGLSLQPKPAMVQRLCARRARNG